MNVVEVTDFTTADTNAVGNAFEATADGQGLEVRSDQAANGDVAADTRLNVSGYSGDTVTVTNTATGNSGFVGSYDGTVTAVTNQNTAATAAISGASRINAAGGSAGDVDSLNQAAGNSQSFGLEYASAGIRANQTNGATVSTDGGGDYAYVSGTANFAAFLAVADALDFHEQIGVSAKAARLAQLRARWTEPLREARGIEILTPPDPRLASAIGAFRLRGRASPAENAQLARTLLDRFGIFTVARTGLASGACVRVTPAIFTGDTDIDRLVAALRALGAS